MSNRTRRSLGLGVLLAVLSGCTIHVYESTGTKTGGQASSGGEAAGGQGDGDRDGADDRDDAQDEDRDGAQDEDRDQDEHEPSTGSGDKPSTGGGDKPSTGGGDKPSTGSGGDKPSTGGGSGDKPSTGSGGDKPATGGGDKPSTGSGGDKPSTGGGDTPTTKPPVLKPPVLKPPVVKPPVVKPPVKPKPDDKPVDPHAGHDGDDGKHDGDTAHGGGTGANPEPGKPQRTEPGHGPKPNLDVDRPVVPSHGSVVTAPDKNKRPSAAHGSLHLPTSAVRTALAPDVCRLYARTFRPGARLRVKVEGAPDSAELYLDGEKLEMVRRDPKAWVAKLPADAKSGVVVLQSGKDAVSCGRIDVK